MLNYELSFHFTNLSPDVADAIQKAIETEQPFGLVSKRTKNVVVFSVKHLKSWWVLQSGVVQAAYSYNDLKTFTEAISMQLLSHKTFVPITELLQSEPVRYALSE